MWGNVISYTVTGLTNGTKYYFVVTATNTSGISPNSNELAATPIAPPPAPVLNTATLGNTQVTLTWALATGATSYSVQYGTSSGVYGAPVSVGNVISYTVTGLTNGTKYYFAVTATNASGTSSNSNEFNATPQVPVPSAPILNTATFDNAQVALVWSISTGATGYYVQYGTSSGSYGTPVNVGNVTNYTVSGLTNGTKYYFVVTATNAGGTSPNSNELNATPISYGYVSGTVIDEVTLLPVHGIWIRAYDWNTNALIDSTQTLSDGTYRFGSLPTGNYRIYADTTGTSYGHEYYNNVESQSSATEVTVTLGTTTQGINFVLAALEEVSTDIHQAFNQICFSVMPQDLPSPYEASQLIHDMALQGITIDIVMQWDSGFWESYQAGLPFTDFDLNLDAGIFIDAVSSEYNAGTWTLDGKKINLPKTVNLYEGWDP